MKFYEKAWFMWVMMVFFFPVGLFLLWMYSGYEKKTKAIITAVVLVLVVYSTTQTKPVVSPQQPPVVKNTSQTQQKAEYPMPKEIGELKQYLENFTPKELNKEESIIVIEKSTNIPNSFLVSLDIHTKTVSRGSSLLYARNFIFATYNATYTSNLPVVYSSVTVSDKNNNRILGIGIGKKVADKLSTETWRDLKMSPSDFEEWTKQNYTQNIVNGKTLFDGRCFIDNH